MLENLLTAARKLDPQHSLDPTPALATAATQLYETAQRAGAAETSDLNAVKTEILQIVDSVEGGLKGSAQEVRTVSTLTSNSRWTRDTTSSMPTCD
ncbi:hypothetical protein [Paraburkholderia sp.]|uniref:hypothetical protein n=1 Tax=Paraburkholderia sp. TaxID=1926495 RepID=UPI003D6E36BF